MSKEMKLIPELRFPEFEWDGEWVEKELGDEEVSSFVNDKVDSEILTLNNYISTDNMLADYSGITKASKLPTTSRVTEFLEGDILISNIRPYLKKVWKSDKNGGASNDVLVFRSGPNVFSDFLEFILKNDAFINYVMQSAKGVKMPRGDKDSMMEYSVCIPSKKEQQKIASCLSSLDDLISAHNDKLDALKDHKKGLLQNLFPKMSASGFTGLKDEQDDAKNHKSKILKSSNPENPDSDHVPRLRFPEFEGDGEWELKPLEEVAKITTGNKDTQDKVDDGKYPFFVRSQTIERINSYSFDGEAILTSGDGVGVGKIYHYIIGKFDFHQRVYCIYDFEKDVEGKFIFYFFSEHFYQRVMQLSAKNSVDSVRRAMITEMPIALPPTKEEQQKIASCLSAVDELITAQQEKIEQLQQHKKGLMQGLFPRISD